MPQLRAEAKEKLSRIRPASLGQASRISGISPADLTVVLMYLGLRRKVGKKDAIAKPGGTDKKREDAVANKAWAKRRFKSAKRYCLHLVKF